MAFISRIQEAFLLKIPHLLGKGMYWRVNSTFLLQEQKLTTFSGRIMHHHCWMRQQDAANE